MLEWKFKDIKPRKVKDVKKLRLVFQVITVEYMLSFRSWDHVVSRIAGNFNSKEEKEILVLCKTAQVFSCHMDC